MREGGWLLRGVRADGAADGGASDWLPRAAAVPLDWLQPEPLPRGASFIDAAGGWLRRAASRLDSRHSSWTCNRRKRHAVQLALCRWHTSPLAMPSLHLSALAAWLGEAARARVLPRAAASSAQCCSLPAAWPSAFARHAPLLPPLPTAARLPVLPTKQPVPGSVCASAPLPRIPAAAAAPLRRYAEQARARHRQQARRQGSVRLGWLAARGHGWPASDLPAVRSTHLQLQRDAAHGAALDTLHQVLQAGGRGGRESAAGGRGVPSWLRTSPLLQQACRPVECIRDCERRVGGLYAHSGEAGNLVAQALGLDDRHLLADALVGVEVQRQALVVLLDDDPAGPQQGAGRCVYTTRTHASSSTQIDQTTRGPPGCWDRRCLVPRTERPSSRSWCARDLHRATAE